MRCLMTVMKDSSGAVMLQDMETYHGLELKAEKIYIWNKDKVLVSQPFNDLSSI